MKNKKVEKKYMDKTLPLEERQEDYSKVMDKIMNPFPDNEFNPDKFEPMGEDMRQVSNRQRKIPPTQLPTYGLKPKEIRNGQLIGMFESKQDLYLIMAHRCNDLQIQVNDLLARIEKLEN